MSGCPFRPNEHVLTCGFCGAAVKDGECECPAQRTSGFDPSRLAKLAERCERATGSDRKLDGAIAKVLGLPHGKESGFCNQDNGDYWVTEQCAKPFTASLDAAMTLVPQGKGWSLDWEPYDSDRAAPAECYIDEQGSPRVYAASPALALSAAALRSIAAAARRAKTAKPVEGEAPQSGHDSGIAQTQSQSID